MILAAITERIRRLFREIHTCSEFSARAAFEIVVHDVFDNIVSARSVKAVNSCCLRLAAVSIEIITSKKKVTKYIILKPLL